MDYIDVGGLWAEDAVVGAVPVVVFVFEGVNQQTGAGVDLDFHLIDIVGGDSEDVVLQFVWREDVRGIEFEGIQVEDFGGGVFAAVLVFYINADDDGVLVDGIFESDFGTAFYNVIVEVPAVVDAAIAPAAQGDVGLIPGYEFRVGVDDGVECDFVGHVEADGAVAAVGGRHGVGGCLGEVVVFVAVDPFVGGVGAFDDFLHRFVGRLGLEAQFYGTVAALGRLQMVFVVAFEMERFEAEGVEGVFADGGVDGGVLGGMDGEVEDEGAVANAMDGTATYLGIDACLGEVLAAPGVGVAGFGHRAFVHAVGIDGELSGHDGVAAVGSGERVEQRAGLVEDYAAPGVGQCMVADGFAVGGMAGVVDG